MNITDLPLEIINKITIVISFDSTETFYNLIQTNSIFVEILSIHDTLEVMIAGMHNNPELAKNIIIQMLIVLVGLTYNAYRRRNNNKIE